jgi:general secretion pathway protein D
MALEHPRLLAASLTAALAGASCSTSSDTSNADVHPDPLAPGVAGQSGANSAQDPQQQGGSTLDQQRRAALVAKYLEVGESLRLEGKLDAALHELLKAKDLQPENEKVLSMIAAVQAERGVPIGGAVDFHSEQMAQQRIAEERSRATVTEKLQRAREMLAAQNYAGAVSELSHAQVITRARDQVDWMGMAQTVDGLLSDAEQKLAEQKRTEQTSFNEQLSQRLAEERRQSEARRRARLDLFLQQSQVAFEGRQFRRAQEFAMKALDADPTSAVAQEMVQVTTKAARDQMSEDYFSAKAREIRALVESREELKVPYTKVLSMDSATWERAQKRSGTVGGQQEMDPQDAAVWELVRSAPVGKLSYTAETGDYTEVVKNLQLVTNVSIIITPTGKEVIDGESLKMEIELVNSVTLENFLNLMVQKSTNLAWTVRNGVVLIGNKSDASGTIQSEVYNVKDLVFKRTQFLPPSIRDIPGSEGSGSDDAPRAGGEGDDKVSFIEIADLVTNIQDATDPAYWGTEGVGITPEDTGYLIVKASPSMQKQVASVLSDMRRFATPVVTIDSKFLTITRNFLQEVGVDFRGLGGSGNKGTTATLDDVTSGLDDNASRGTDNGGTADPAANPVSGAFFNDGGDGDIRGRTENFFTTGLGQSLTPNGGFTASWAYLGDTQLQMILRAVEKQEDAEVVNSQYLSVLDKERGHVAVINQTAYVRDFDVEVAQASFIADPKVDVIQDGIVLDVQPVIQQDRKYIILNLTPTIAELSRPIPTFTTSLAGSTLPVTLQLPNLRVTSFATTVQVPDGGTVLLGGLRQVLTRERRAEVPLLSRLPLISFFFKQEGAADENRSLMVMVRAWITDIRETEGK